ncbi:MAG: discoidin domain-containing protein [Dysgonamonadaceae bacterium]|jgi:hypothetical protein|nr:discoidin domain-containing protein [Dysgonamonadaceae bacterium]
MKKNLFLLLSLWAIAGLTSAFAQVIPSAGHYYNVAQLPASNNVVWGENTNNRPVVQSPDGALAQVFRFAPVYGKPDTYCIVNGNGKYLNKDASSGWNTLFETAANGENSQWVIKNDGTSATSFRLMLVANSGYLASDAVTNNSVLYCDKSSSHANGRFLLQACSLSAERWMQILNRTLLEATADTTAIHNATNAPGYNNLEDYRTTLANANSVSGNDPAATVEAAVVALTVAIDEYDAITAAYSALKTAITEFTAKLNASEYPDKTTFTAALAQAQAAYDSPADQRAQIASIIENLTAESVILTTYARLKNEIAKAKRTLNTTDYPDKTALQNAISVAEGIYTNPAGEDIPAAINNLNTALTAYLNGRPSNRTTIRNGALRKDQNGNSVQAHGAGFLQSGDTWYMVGEDRTSWNQGVNLYSSKDFVQWTFERKIIPPSAYSSARFIERPKLLYCAATGKYVVWCHYEGDNYGSSEAASFVCDSVNGLYSLQFGGRPLGIKSRDCNVFVDEDGTAYFVSTTDENQNLTLFKLSEDYLYPVESYRLSTFNGKQREAPAIVRIGNTYFLISSLCTGWDPNQATISHSTSLTSGWTSQTNIGNGITFDTQAASVLTIQGREGTSYIYVGDRWQDPGLAESKTIMFPIQFSGNTCTFNYRQCFDLDIPTGKWSETDNTGYFVPKTNWSIHSYSSQETSSENSPATNAIDGNRNTRWHTKYSGNASVAPHSIAVDMKAEYPVSGFLCVPRLDNTSGLIREFLFQVSLDATNWETVAGGTWLPYYSEVYFTPTQARYFRLVSVSGNHAAVAELDIIRGEHGYSPPAITPRYRVGSSGSWQNGSTITASQTGSLTFSPTAAGTGTWAWSLPQGKAATGRELSISNILPADSGAYTACFLNPYLVSGKKDFQLTVTRSTAVATRKLKYAIQQAQAVYGSGLIGSTVLNNTIDEALAMTETSSTHSIEQKDSMRTVLLDRTAAYLASNIASGSDKTSVIATPDNFTTKTPQGWTGTMPTAVGNGCAEFLDTTFTFSQTLNNLENGHYLVGVQALYRAGANDAGAGYENANESQSATFFANDRSVFVQSLYSTPYSGNGTLNGFANTMGAVDYLFDQSENNYANRLLVRVEDNTLNLGLTKSTKRENDWCIFNNFRLICLDAPSAVGKVTVNNPVSVCGTLNGIKVIALERTAVKIYSVTGQLVESKETSGTEFIPLPKGMYIVNRNKIIVR